MEDHVHAYFPEYSRLSLQNLNVFSAGLNYPSKAFTGTVVP